MLTLWELTDEKLIQIDLLLLLLVIMNKLIEKQQDREDIYSLLYLDL